MKEVRFKENLRELRLEKGITQKKLGEILGVDQRTVSAWEKGICEPNYSMLLRICDYFDESANSLLFGDLD